MNLPARFRSWLKWIVKVRRLESEMETEVRFHIESRAEDLKVVGYWVPEDAPAWDNTFIFMVAHSSREEAKKNWDAFRADPEFQEVIKSEQANKTVEKIDVTYMRPADFSPMK